MVKKAILFSFIGIQSVILALLLFAADRTDHYIKKEQLFPNPVYFAAGAAAFFVLLGLGYLFLKYCSEEAFRKKEKVLITVTLLLFLGISLIICMNGFFYSDWDPAGVLRGAYSIMRGKPEDAGESYFLHYSNNLLLAEIYSLILKAGKALGTESVLLLVAVQCILLSGTAFVTYRILKDMLKDNRLAFMGLLCFEIWIGLLLSPWFIITYSDQMGFILPVLELRLGQKLSAALDGETAGRGETPGGGKAAGYRILILAALTALACFGYFIKPQTVIVYIAIVLFLTAKFIGRIKARGMTPENAPAGSGAASQANAQTNPRSDSRAMVRADSQRKSLWDTAAGAAGAAVVTGALTLLLVRGVIIPSAGIKTDPSSTIGLTHYFMMGLNDRTDGVFAAEDTEVSLRGEDLKVAGERIRNYGFRGLLRHAARKTMVNFNDGSFAWGIDGEFFAGRESDSWGDVPETPVTERIWDFIITEGSDHGKYASALQSIWFGVLALDLAAAIIMLTGSRGKGGAHTPPISRGTDTSHTAHTAPARREEDTLLIVMLSLLGLFLFELLFEAKARYLLIYTPFYLMPCIYVLQEALDRHKDFS